MQSNDNWIRSEAVLKGDIGSTGKDVGVMLEGWHCRYQ